MAKQEINYTAGNDSGERDVASIAPVNAGEKVKSTVVDRPMESLRNRSEVVRDELINQMYLQDTDMGWIMSDGQDPTGYWPVGDLPQIVWDPGTGTFAVLPDPGGALVLQPIKTPGTDTTETQRFEFPSLVPTGYLDISSTLRNYAGQNRRRIIWEAVDPATIAPNNAVALMEGTPGHILRIQVRNDYLTTTISDVTVALFSLNALLPGGLAAFGFSYSSSAPATEIVDYLPPDFEFSKVHERELHRIPCDQFTAFFATNSLQDGDTLAIYYEWMAEPEPAVLPLGGRRQSCPINTNVTLIAGQLFNTTQNPEKIPLGIPICKRIGNDLIFVDGTICYGNAPLPIPVYCGENGYTLQRIIDAADTTVVNIVNTWYNAFVVTGATGTINEALNGIVGDLALTGLGDCGGLRVGTQVVAGIPDGYPPDSLATNSVAEQLDELLVLANARIKTIHPTASSGNWILLWRSSNATTDPDVTKLTSSLYWVNGAFSLVCGAYWSDPTHVTVGTGGTTDVAVSIWSAGDGTIRNYICANPAPGTVLNVNDVDDWTTVDFLGATEPTNAMWGPRKTFYNPITFNQQVWFEDDLHYETGVVLYRAAPADVNWHLIYRNCGDVIDADVTSSTLSIYEKNTATFASRMSVYGGYLDAAGIIHAPVAAGPIFFIEDENYLGAQRMGWRGSVAGGTTVNPATNTDWDYYETFLVVFAPDCAHRTYGVPKSLVPPGRSSVTQRWDIDTEISREVSFTSTVAKINGAPGTSVTGLIPFLDCDSADDKRPKIWYCNDEVWITVNAAFDGTNWSVVDAGVPATALRLTNMTIHRYIKRYNLGATWLTSQWAQNDDDSFDVMSGVGHSSRIYHLDSLGAGVTEHQIPNVDFVDNPGLYVLTATLVLPTPPYGFPGTYRATALYKAGQSSQYVLPGQFANVELIGGRFLEPVFGVNSFAGDVLQELPLGLPTTPPYAPGDEILVLHTCGTLPYPNGVLALSNYFSHPVTNIHLTRLGT